MKKTPLSFGLLFGLSLVTTVTFAVPANAATDNDQLKYLLSLNISDLVNVETSLASRTLEKIKDAPSSITIFTRQELLNMGISTLDEIYNFVPGMQNTRRAFDASFSTPTIRGTQQTWGNEFQFMIDGLRVQDPYSGGPSLFNRFVSLDNIERIEIIRGPGSTLYGANAFLGIVNVITAKDLNNITVEGGSFSHQKISANYSKQKDAWHFRSFINAFSDNGEDYNGIFDSFGRTDTTNDPKNGIDLSAAIGYKDITLSSRYIERETENFYNWDKLSNGLALNKTKLNQTSLKYNLPLSAKWSGEVLASHTRAEWRGRGVFELQGVGPYIQADFIAGPVMKYNDYTLSADFSYDLTPTQLLNFGGNYENSEIPRAGHNSNYDFLNGFAYLGPITDQFDPSIRFVKDIPTSVRGFYIQDKISFTENVSATIGARYDRFNNFGETVNPRASFIYHKSNVHSYKLLFGKAFRSPSMVQLATQNNPAIIGNTDLQPETVTTFELVHTYSGPKTHVTSTLYHNEIKSLLTLSDNGMGLLQYQNAGSNKSAGLEIEFLHQPTDALYIRGTFSHILFNETDIAANIVADKSEDFTPSQLASITINYQTGNWNLNASSFMRTDITKLDDQGNFAILNSNIQYKFNKNITSYFTAKNILNKQFKDTASGSSGLGTNGFGDIERGIPNRGRELFIGMRYEF